MEYHNNNNDNYNNLSTEISMIETDSNNNQEKIENKLYGSVSTSLKNFNNLGNKIPQKEMDEKDFNSLDNILDSKIDNKEFNIYNLGNMDVNDKIKSDENENSEVFGDIKHILTSTLRTKLLIALFSSKKDLKSLRDELDKPSTSILHGIKELRKLKLIKKEDKFYELSSNGRILAANILKLIENTYSINNNFEFWKYHTIEAIPQNFLKKIYHIHNARSISSKDSSVGGIFRENSNEYLELVSKSRKIRILTSIFFDIHLDMIINNLNNNKNLELITTEEILDFMKINGYGYKWMSLEKDLNIKIWKFPKDFH